MKKPTKAQRHAIYKKAMAELPSAEFICIAIQWATLCGWDPYQPDFFIAFPEVLEQKPESKRAGYGGVWWNLNKKGAEARRRALQRCIDMTAPRKKTEKP